jgi:hypothetical protein
MRKEPLPPTNAVFDVSQEEIDGFFNFSPVLPYFRSKQDCRRETKIWTNVRKLD